MRKILIVDDLAFTRNMVKNILNECGFTDIREAEDAVTAKKLFASEKPDLVILDIILPDSKDLSLLKELLQISPSAKIIIYSAVSQQSIIIKAVKMGACDYLLKPANRDEIYEVVTKVLNR